MNTKIIVALITLLSIANIANATTIFARQYDMKCNACHVGVPPTLNKTGSYFLRNGMRFSQNDSTTLQEFLSKEDRLVPIGFFIGNTNKRVNMESVTPKGKVSKNQYISNPMVNLFLSGSINENFSTFVGFRFAYIKPNPNESHREFNLLREKVYLQYNDGISHISRAGVLYLYPESSENSGLSDFPNIYISPLDRGNLKPLYGAQYSYYINNDLSFFVAGGIVGRLNNERSILGGLNYDYGNYSIGLIVNNITATNDNSKISQYTPSEIILGERISIMTPFQYEFKYGYINVTGVYEKNDRVISGDYYGLETSITVPVFETGNVRFIYTTDNKEEQGYAFKYAQVLFDNIFINTNIAKVNTPKVSFDSVSFGANIIF